MDIPHVIMQTWKDKNIPKEWQISQNSISKHFPTWKYVLMTDKSNRNFVKKHFPNLLQIYDEFPYHIQRVDII
jgi:mannosyltransferase OCH1-like enzyme